MFVPTQRQQTPPAVPLARRSRVAEAVEVAAADHVPAGARPGLAAARPARLLGGAAAAGAQAGGVIPAGSGTAFSSQSPGRL